jgi:hypothetical protein
MLAEELAGLASAGGTALVTAMVTDGWENARARFARLLGRGKASETQKAAARLDQSKAALAATPGTDLDRVRADQVTAWRTRLEDLLEDDPDAKAELQALVTEIQARVIGSAGRVEQHATASDRAQQAVLGHGVQNVHFGGQRETDGGQ